MCVCERERERERELERGRARERERRIVMARHSGVRYVLRREINLPPKNKKVYFVYRVFRLVH